MTVTYNADVATVRGFGCFLKLLMRWRGSIYKLVWLDLIIFLFIYYTLSIIYRLLSPQDKNTFEAIVKYCDHYSNLIPLSFVLGFYVSVIMTRWWNQYLNIPHPDPVAVFVSATVHGHDERGRVMRRTIMRYVCLCVTMVFTMISPRVKKRFPTLDHFVDAGLLQASEKEIMEDLNNKFPKYSKHWLPLVWASSIVTRARKEGRIRDDFAVKTIIDELNKFRGKCGVLLTYDHINIPLVYTQVVTLAVYSYFLTNIMAHQWTEKTPFKFDLYFPIFTTLQFFFYIGWLKVAESMINPFGDDDDDFEVNWMVDRNLQVSYMIVDEMHHDHPELVRDQYWDERFPQELPSTQASRAIRDSYPLPSTANIANKPQDQELMTPSLPKMDDMQSYTGLDGGPITFSAKPRPQSFRSRGSQNSLGTSVPDAMSRHNSVTNMLKRFFSRDESRAEEKLESNEMNNLIGDQFTKVIGSNKKITDQVIEEVDEQATINSQRSAKEPRPSVINFFGPPSPTTPIDVPIVGSHGSRGVDVYDPFERISTSVPGTSTDGKNLDNADNVSIGGSLTDDDDEDEFSRLKKLREEERLSRFRSRLSRSYSMKPEEQELLPKICSNKTLTPQSPRTPRF